MRRFLTHGVCVLALASCGGRAHRDAPATRASVVARPLEMYRQLGMLVGPFDFPAVARFNTLAGPADSAYVILSMSMPNSAIRFQRNEAGFSADYRVSLTVLRDTQQIKQVDRKESVRVGGFAETTRTEESILFQDVFTLPPGRYFLRLQVADQNSSRGFRAVDTLDVPFYSNGVGLSSPVLLYEGKARNHNDERPAFLINTRNTVAYGADNPKLYVEAYGPRPTPLQLRITDESGAALWTAQATLRGSAQLTHALVDIPASALPIGKLSIEVGDSSARVRTPLLISISDQWLVANFDDVLRFLDYIANPAEMDSLRRAVGTHRRDQWESFWSRRDPLPATPVNEFREQFFERVRAATEQFMETGRPGWETDRGKVYIVLGAPDNSIARSVGRDASAQPNLVEWLYESLPGGRLVLQFIDRNGFGHYELTQSSEAEFRSVAARMRPRL